MKKLLIAAGLIVGTLSVAGPAYAIHDPNVPAGECANSTQAVGLPATGKAQTAFSNTVLIEHNTADPHC